MLSGIYVHFVFSASTTLVMVQAIFSHILISDEDEDDDDYHTHAIGK